MTPKRIRVEVLPNSDTRDFHVTTQISAEQLHGGVLGGSRHDPFYIFSVSEEKKVLSDDTKETVMRFYDIDGVQSVGLDSYSVKIERSPAYEWEDIEDDIIATIKVVADWSDEDVEVDYLFMGTRYADGVPRDVYEAEIAMQRAEARRARMYGGF